MRGSSLSKISEFSYRYYVKELFLISLFFGFIFGYKQIEALMKLIWSDFKPTIEWESLSKLAFDYMMMVVSASLISFLVAFTLGALIHVYKLNELKALMKSVVDFGVTFPTIALIAILVPVMGYGFKSVVVALILYGLLPILTNTIKGLETVDTSIVTSAYGMGMSTWQTFYLCRITSCHAINTCWDKNNRHHKYISGISRSCCWGWRSGDAYNKWHSNERTYPYIKRCNTYYFDGHIDGSNILPT